MQQLQTLVSKLELQQAQKRDLILPSSKLEYRDGKLFIAEEFAGHDITDICHDQIAAKLGIPANYYRRMQSEFPGLLEKNINGWLMRENKKNYLVRTFAVPESEAVARALLSDRYNMIDNYDVLFAALEAIKQMGVNIKITRAEVTDRRMYLHVTCPEVEMQAESFLRAYMKDNDAVGNGIITGLLIANSEVGQGTFEVMPRAEIVKCNNGLIVKDQSFRKIHLGGKQDTGEIVWSERTKQKNYELIISQTQDAIKTYLSKDYLGRMIERIADIQGIELKKPVDAVQNVCRELQITEEHKSNILRYFMNDGDHMATGIMQAVTREAQAMTPDMQYDVETKVFDTICNIKKFDKEFKAFSKN